MAEKEGVYQKENATRMTNATSNLMTAEMNPDMTKFSASIDMVMINGSAMHTHNEKPEIIEAYGSSKLGLIYGISTQLFPTLPKDLQHSLDKRRPIRIQFRSCNLRQIGL
jgi:hypothetical protein